MSFLNTIIQYLLFIKRVFSKPDKSQEFYSSLGKEIVHIGYQSTLIVIIISFFMGAVITLQAAYNLSNPLLPKYFIGMGTRESVILEFSSTIVALVLAGKVGSNIASQIGSMRVTSQIDALEIMGINSANFLVFPKVIASVITFPFLGLLSMIMGIIGGWMAGVFSGAITSADYIYGIQVFFVPYHITYSVIKIAFFGALITSVSAFYGYHAKGGALEVGNASTKAVVNSTLQILIFNLVLTFILL